MPRKTRTIEERKAAAVAELMRLEELEQKKSAALDDRIVKLEARISKLLDQLKELKVEQAALVKNDGDAGA